MSNDEHQLRQVLLKIYEHPVAGINTPRQSITRRSIESPFFVPAASMAGRAGARKSADPLTGSVNSAWSATLGLTPKRGGSQPQSEDTAMQTLIPISSRIVAGTPVQTVQARKLHAFLDVGRDCSTWINNRIVEYGFSENEDFIVCSPKRGSKGRGGHNVVDHYLTLDMAKELAMVERNDKGREARRYFIDCERELKERKAQEVLALPARPFDAPKRYVVIIEGGRVTHMKELDNDLGLVPGQRVRIVRQNLHIVREQLLVLLGEMSVSALDVPLVAFDDAATKGETA